MTIGVFLTFSWDVSKMLARQKIRYILGKNQKIHAIYCEMEYPIISTKCPKPLYIVVCGLFYTLFRGEIVLIFVGFCSIC